LYAATLGFVLDAVGDAFPEIILQMHQGDAYLEGFFRLDRLDQALQPVGGFLVSGLSRGEASRGQCKSGSLEHHVETFCCCGMALHESLLGNYSKHALTI